MAGAQRIDEKIIDVGRRGQITPGFGSGIYTYHEAARLLNVNSSRVRGWAVGYVYPVKGGESKKSSVLQRVETGEGLLTFHDLIELFTVKKLREAGVKLEKIRAASVRLAEDLQTPYPFASKKVYTDGWQILQKAGHGYEEIATKQAVFDYIQDFFKNIDFDKNKLARLWFPLGKAKMIVMDPQRSFGAPIDLRSGVRTDILYATYKAEEDIDAVADWYEVKRSAVEAAIEFEEQWKKAA